MNILPADSVNLVLTRPPYALHFKKEYWNVAKADYVDWFLSFAHEIFRVLKENGSFVLNIGGSHNKGTPTRSLYHFKLLIALVEEAGFRLTQECFWYNPAKMPAPAEWVGVRRVRIKDSVEYVWWLSKTPHPKANNRNVLKPYGPDMLRLNQRGVRTTVRPSGHIIGDGFDGIGAGGAIPSNVIESESAPMKNNDDIPTIDTTVIKQPINHAKHGELDQGDAQSIEKLLNFRVLSVTSLDLSHALPADLFRHHARSPKGCDK